MDKSQIREYDMKNNQENHYDLTAAALPNYWERLTTVNSKPSTAQEGNWTDNPIICQATQQQADEDTAVVYVTEANDSSPAGLRADVQRGCLTLRMKRSSDDTSSTSLMEYVKASQKSTQTTNTDTAAAVYAKQLVQTLQVELSIQLYL